MEKRKKGIDSEYSASQETRAARQVVDNDTDENVGKVIVCTRLYNVMTLATSMLPLLASDPLLLKLLSWLCGLARRAGPCWW